MRAIFVAAAVFAAMPALATADETDEADTRCVLVAFKMFESGNAEQRNQGLASAMYFLGRLDSRRPNADLSAEIYAQNRAMTQAQLRSEAQRCGAILTKRGQEIVSMGEKIDEWERQDALRQAP